MSSRRGLIVAELATAITLVAGLVVVGQLRAQPPGPSGMEPPAGPMGPGGPPPGMEGMGMPGMEGHHPPMRMGGVKVSVSADRKSLVATMTRALPMGSYVVNWHVAGSDAVRVTGKMSFSAR